jgi:hypothetical protein
MEGFTLVLFIAWLVLLASFAAVYFMDRAVAASEKGKAAAPAPSSKAQSS